MKIFPAIQSKSKILSGILAATFCVSIFLPVIAVAAETPTDRSIQLELNPNENPVRKKSPLSYEIKPTKSVEDVLTIKNFSDEKAFTVKVYAVDSLQGTDGAIAFKLEDRPRNNIGKWVTFNQDTATIEAGQIVYLPYRIDIPDRTPPGTFQGGLVAEIVENGLPGKAANNAQIQVVSRLIESVIISVPGRKILKYNLDDFSYHETGGQPYFNLKFSNQSNILLRAKADLKIEGTLLDNPYELSLNNLTVLQGESLEKRMLFKNPPLLGGYKATLTFDVYEYSTATDNLIYLTTITREVTFTIIPWWAIITLILIILILCCIEKYRRKYVKGVMMDTFIHLVKKGETILSIAGLYQVNWKTIAKLNKLKTPYTIVPGDILNLPFPHEKKPPVIQKKRRSSLDKKGE